MCLALDGRDARKLLRFLRECRKRGSGAPTKSRSRGAFLNARAPLPTMEEPCVFLTPEAYTDRTRLVSGVEMYGLSALLILRLRG